MDSGNSGSLQSSSGGDEEYDSRAAVSAFMSGAAISNPPPPQQQQPFFDPLSSYLQLLQHNNNPNPNSAWARIRSDTNPIPHDLIINSSAAFVPTFHPPPPPSAPAVATRNPTAPGRNTKKRSRASRRAPTTVLTTDTTNFRAMVQEFTGIPAPPFDSSPFQRTRLDLFGASRSAANSFDAPYLRRPFAQKVHPPIPSSSGSTSNPAAAVNNNNYHSSPMNLFQNPFLTNFLSPKFTFSDPKPGPLQIPPSNHHPQFGNHFSPQHNGVDGSGGFGNLPQGEGGKLPDNNIGGGGEGMVESWICSSE